MGDESKDVCRVEGVIAGAAKGQDVVGKFNSECSLQDRREFFNNLQSQGTPTDNSRSGTHAASMLGGFKIEYDSVKRTLDDVHKPGQPGGQSPGGDGAHATRPRTGADSGRKPESHAAATPADTGRRGLDDADSRLQRSLLSPSERTLATKIEKDLLAGNDVSKDINGLSRDAKTRVMAEVKGHLAETPGTTTSVAQPRDIDSARYITMQTAGGKKLLFTESSLGTPQDIVVNTGSMLSKLTGATDVYDRPGETKTQDTSSGSSWVDKLRGKPIDPWDPNNNSPAARLMRGEPVTAEEEADMRKKGIIYTPKDRSE